MSDSYEKDSKIIAKNFDTAFKAIEDINNNFKGLAETIEDFFKILLIGLRIIELAMVAFIIYELIKLLKIFYIIYWIHEAHDTHLAILGFGGVIIAAIIAYPCWWVWQKILPPKDKGQSTPTGMPKQ